MRLFTYLCLILGLTGCEAWNNGPFGYRPVSKDHGTGTDQVNTESLRQGNEESRARTTPMDKP